MNSIQDLTSHGINISTAENMLNEYENRIGKINGTYVIADINYDFSICGKDVTLKCLKCSKIIHRSMIRGKNKWSELIKTCDCQKEQKKHETEKNLKNKKDQLLSEIGKVYGDYIVVSVEFGNPNKFVMNCIQCGEKIKVSSQNVLSGKWKAFDCKKQLNQEEKYGESYIGRKNNYLTVIGIERNKRGERRFLCECECGKSKLIQPCLWESGRIKSCGCKHDELLKTHGLSRERLYSIWSGMNQRCFNPKSHAWNNYGGRGITVCSEWLGENGLRNFVEWARLHGYADELSIDRIDVNGNYEPKNCRWATQSMQLENRRPQSQWKKRTEWKHKRKAFIEIDGKIISKRELCDRYGITEATFNHRIKKMGMTVEKALTTPLYWVGRSVGSI